MREKESKGEKEIERKGMGKFCSEGSEALI